MLNYQLRATNALIRFREEHGMDVPEELRLVRRYLLKGDPETAAGIARHVRVFGEGGLDSTPVTETDQDSDYNRVLHESLLRNWMLWISLSMRSKKSASVLKQFFGIPGGDPTPA